MASTAGFPLSLHRDDATVLLLSDSEDDDAPSTPRHKHKHIEVRVDTAELDGNVAPKIPAAPSFEVPTHPISAMQAAFAESLVEATSTSTLPKPKLRFGDAKARRAKLIDGARDAELHTDLWRYRLGQSHHELWKLMAQISFGVYLLLNGIANDNGQVVTILQGHIDEVDEFLETAMEDVNVAVVDVKERIRFLKLPMDNMTTFENMLEDRAFRAQIVAGNETIEHLISRTAKAFDATGKDIEVGLKSTKEFAVYLKREEGGRWRTQRPDVVDIFDAMMGNSEGWFKAFAELQETTSNLDALLAQLSQVVTEIDQRAGEVSRRAKFQIAPYSNPTSPSESTAESSQRSSASRTLADMRSSRSATTITGSPSQSPASSTTPSVRDTLSELEGGSRWDRVPTLRAPRSAEFESGLEVVTESNPRALNIVEEDKFLILQPRTYSPQSAGPQLSPTVYELPQPLESRESRETVPMNGPSLRQRLSLKGNRPPGSIRVPQRELPPRDTQHSGSLNSMVYNPHNSGQIRTAELDSRPAYSRAFTTSTGYPGLTPPPIPSTIPSPSSDRQFFRPVQASPHSPLQRPWTSHTSAPPRPHTSGAHRPSLAPPSHHGLPPNIGSLPSIASRQGSVANLPNGTIKKKRSAFGWFKKAFSLSDEERAAFEARKVYQVANAYSYQGPRSPNKFLDGKRRPEYGRY